MGKIVMSGPQNMSLNGVVQEADGAEGFPRGGWFVESGGKDLEAWNELALEEARRAEAWLRGRTSYGSSADGGARGPASSPTGSTACPST
jgi:hypothetical protein